MGIGLVQLGGFEPPTSGSTIRRSNQLSYNCTIRRGRKLGSPPGKSKVARNCRVAAAAILGRANPAGATDFPAISIIWSF